MENNFENIQDLTVNVYVELGKTKISIKNLLTLNKGAIIQLNTLINNPLNFFANGKLLGTCELIKMDDKVGIRILSLIKSK